MESLNTKDLILKRQSHPAWQLLASPRAPLVLGCLKHLFEGGIQDIPLEDAREHLSKILATHANSPEYEINTDDFRAFARKEIREWIRKGLLVERGGAIFATDALQKAFRFIESIENRAMTSTASRLATVQQRIETLETNLNPDKQSRVDYIKSKIADLKKELEQVQAGNFQVLEGERAGEEIQEVYSLAMSLRADFRRIEDSFRDADRALRQSIISEEQHRGEVVDKLLATNDALLETPEGRVFSGFYDQINRSSELENMRNRLRRILANPSAGQALDPKQSSDLRWLVSRLIDESQNVMRARARSERDVKGFIKTGLAAEHHRVGGLLQQIMETVLRIDWSKAAVRRADAPFEPIAPGQAQLPVPERICFKEIEDVEEATLNLEQQHGSLDALEESFLENFDELDRTALFRDTLDLLRKADRPHTLRELAEQLPPKYDLETLTYWMTLAREAELRFDVSSEAIELFDPADGKTFRFNVPTVALHAAALETIDPEILE